MKKILRSAAFILVLVLLLGVAVSYARNISEDEDVGILSWFEGVLPGLSEADDASGDEPSGGGSSGSSGGTAPASTTAATAEPEAPPTPSNFWNTSLKRYTLEGYNAYPASTVSDEWFFLPCDDYVIGSLEGNNVTFEPGHSVLSGQASFGTQWCDWDFLHLSSEVSAVGISFVLDPSTCADFCGAIEGGAADYDQGVSVRYPLFEVVDGVLHVVDFTQEPEFWVIDIDEEFSHSVLAAAHYGSALTSSSCRILILASLYGFTVYVNDQLVGSILPDMPSDIGGYQFYNLSHVLTLAFDGYQQNVVLESVCFYVK